MSRTPPWRTDDWDLESDLVKLEQQWPVVRRILESEALADRRDPDVSAWSCGQHAEHLLLIAKRMADEIEVNLAQPDRNTAEAPSELAPVVLSKGGFKRGVAQSPPEFVPDAEGRTDSLDLLSDVVDAWERLSGQSSALRDCPARSLHFALGYFTSAEWVRMCAIHTAHHLRLVRDIVGEEALRPAGDGTDT